MTKTVVYDKMGILTQGWDFLPVLWSQDAGESVSIKGQSVIGGVTWKTFIMGS